MHASILASQSLQTLFSTKLAEHPCSPAHPWNLIIYSDEVTPGNVLSTSNKRKLQCVYWSFREFGPAALAHEECWFTWCIELSTTVNRIQGGMSKMFGVMLHEFFDASGLNLSTNGVLLPGPNNVKQRLWASCKLILQDGAAHKTVWCSRGMLQASCACYAATYLLRNPTWSMKMEASYCAVML